MASKKLTNCLCIVLGDASCFWILKFLKLVDNILNRFKFQSFSSGDSKSYNVVQRMVLHRKQIYDNYLVI